MQIVRAREFVFSLLFRLLFAQWNDIVLFDLHNCTVFAVFCETKNPFANSDCPFLAKQRMEMEPVFPSIWILLIGACCPQRNCAANSLVLRWNIAEFSSIRNNGWYCSFGSSFSAPSNHRHTFFYEFWLCIVRRPKKRKEKKSELNETPMRRKRLL